MFKLMLRAALERPGELLAGLGLLLLPVLLLFAGLAAGLR